ncbi:MAG: metalloregulator ArsR/SmtB family transcription factor [Rectinemataceae bacterium]
MGSLAEDAGFAAHMAEVVKALGHPVRLRTVALLCRNEESVNTLAGLLGVEQPILSQQLRILRLAGLVKTERKDGFAVYRLAEPRLQTLIACLESCTLFEKEGI